MKFWVWMLMILTGIGAVACGRQAVAVAPTATLNSVRPTATSTPPQPSGALIILDGADYPHHRMVRYDFATEQLETVFSAPQLSWIYQLQVSPDGERVVFAYSPPPGDGRGLFDRSGIYQLSLTAANAEPAGLIAATQPNEFHYQPTFSPDGRFLYYVKYQPDPNAVLPTFRVTLERYDFSLGQTQPLVNDGIWPRVSPQGDRLVFIGVDPMTLRRGLYASQLEGSAISELVPLGYFFDIDAPIFSPDGAWVYFSVAKEPPQSSWFERLLGVKTAYAHADHNVPSDWWRVSLTGDNLEQLTDEQRIIFNGDFAPDGEHLAFSTLTGLYVMRADGSDVTLLDAAQTYGTLTWLEK